MLSFKYNFEFGEDKVFFAYSIPYSFTMLSNFLRQMTNLQTENSVAIENNTLNSFNDEGIRDSQTKSKYRNLVFKYENVGKTVSGLPIPMVTITDFSKASKKKRTLLMTARIYSGETHSSWVVHGFIQFLCVKSTIARQLRSRFVFKILPMLNIDGVVAGNYRSTFAGLDINRCFTEKMMAHDNELKSRMNPEANLFKKIAKAQQRLDFFFDLHTHTGKKSMFMYGTHFPLHSEHYLKVRVLPKLLAELSVMLRYYSCRFKAE